MSDESPLTYMGSCPFFILLIGLVLVLKDYIRKPLIQMYTNFKEIKL